MNGTSTPHPDIVKGTNAIPEPPSLIQPTQPIPTEAEPAIPATDWELHYPFSPEASDVEETEPSCSDILGDMRDLIYKLLVFDIAAVSGIKSKLLKGVCLLLSWAFGSAVLGLILIGALGVVLAAGLINTLNWVEDRRPRE